MMAAAAAAHRPPKNKYLGTQEGVMYPNKKAKFCHHHGDVTVDTNGDNSSSANGTNNEENNTNDHRHMSSSPTDVLTHPTAAAAPSTSTVAANNTNGIFSAAAVVKTLPPSLKGIAEAAKGLNSSLRNIHNCRLATAHHLQQKSSLPRQQLVAFPTEALYVLTCCVKTTSKKKIILANTAAAADSRNHNESTASSSLIGSSSSSCSYGDIHPSNPSLDHLLSRQTPIIHHQQQEEGNLLSSSRAMPTPSVFVIDNKHAQHYCQFSAPKIFAIRPKQQSRSDLMADGPSSSSSSLLMAGTNNSSGVESKMNHHPLKQDEEQELGLGLGCTNNNTSYSPSSSPRIQKSSLLLSSSSISSTGEPAPDCGVIAASASSSSLCFPMTPKTTADNTTPSSTSSVATVSPIIANNVAIAHMNDAKMPPSLPLSSHSRPSNNHSSNSKLGTSKILAANFSESYEAFSRLTNKFWPGPMIIYAPARMIRVGNTTTGCTDLSSSLQKSSHNNWQRSSSTESSSSSSCPSLPSFTNLYSLEKGEGAAGNKDSQEVPVLPPPVLIPLRDLLPDRNDGGGNNNNTNNEEQFFIGMQCPSHPLARKILTEIYRPRRGSITSTTSASSLPMTHSTSTESFASFSSLDTSITFPHCRQGKQQQHVRCGVAVVGSYVAPLLTGGSSSSGSSSTVANSATNVTKILLSSASSNVNRAAAEQIYVVNGEDTTHENFSVPTCNYGGVSPISLVVDGDNRTMHLLRHHQNGHDVVSGGCKNIHKDKIYRALLQPPSSLRSSTAINVDNCSNNKASSTREIDRVITAVLSRWKVVEHHV